MKIERIAQGVNVGPMLWALQAHPELWDQNTQRTRSADSPHYDLSDIWARYAAPGVDASGPHDAVWYPCADVIPVRDLVFPLVAAVRGTRLGGVLITRIPAGKQCRPHVDIGWHASFYEKFAIQLQSAPGQFFDVDGDLLETQPGDVFTFNNLVTHRVLNPTLFDRITLIACIRRD